MSKYHVAPIDAEFASIGVVVSPAVPPGRAYLVNPNWRRPAPKPPRRPSLELLMDAASPHVKWGSMLDDCTMVGLAPADGKTIESFWDRIGLITIGSPLIRLDGIT